MPKEFKVENEYSNMTNEQIAQRIRELDAAIAAELGNASHTHDVRGSQASAEFGNDAGSGEADGGAAPSSTKH
jgi:hypothetical protein